MTREEMRAQHKAFAHWYLGLRGTNEVNFNPEDLAWAAWKAALVEQRASKPEAEAQPVAWMWQHDETGRIGFIDTWQLENGWRELNPRLNVVRPLYAHPPRDAWRPASEPPEDGRAVLVWCGRIGTWAQGWHDGLDWRGSHEGHVTRWRDVQPPTEGER